MENGGFSVIDEFVRVFGVLYSVSSIVSLASVVGGIFVSLVSLSVLGLWVGVELNFLGAICFVSGTSVMEGESVMKYFMVQVLGSCFMVLGFLMVTNYCFVGLVNMFVLLGLLLKLGVFPFHFWVPSVMSSLSWFGCFVVSVFQKIIPLWLLSNLSVVGKELSVLEVLGSLTCVVGCLGGLGVLSYRVLLAYSSLIHLGFLVILCCVSMSCFWFYMLFYLLINLCLMWSLMELAVFSFADLLKEKESAGLTQLWWVSLYFFSLAGLPPFSGCVLKIYFLLNCWEVMPVGSLVCVLSSIVSLYFYLSVVLNIVVFWGKSLMISDSKVGVFDKIGGLSVVVNLAVGFMMFLCLGL